MQSCSFYRLELSAAKVKFRIEVDRKEIAEHVKMRNWVPVSIEIGAFKVSDIKFVFVLE